MSDTSTSKCLPGDGPPSPEPSFDEAWRHSQPPSPALRTLFEKIIRFFGLQDVPNECRCADNTSHLEELDTSDGSCCAPYGRYIRILINKECGRDTSEPGTYVAATLVHEVLHVLFWESDSLHEAAIDDPKLSDVLNEVRDQLVDKLAWTLLPHIVPDLDPTEDFFEATSTLPTYVLGSDPGDEWTGPLAVGLNDRGHS